MEEQKQFTMDEIKQSLENMGIPYEEKDAPENQQKLVKTYRYEPLPLVVDLTKMEKIDAESGVIVRNMDDTVDNGVYAFTVLRSGQAGFLVVIPGTISRAPLVRKVAGDLISVINGVDLPPLTPYDMVEILGHVIPNTFIDMIMESCQIPKAYKKQFMNLYMPKFIANIGLYFTGATKEDGSPMIYEEVVNMEPMMIWNAMRKEAEAKYENAAENDSDERGHGDADGAGEE